MEIVSIIITIAQVITEPEKVLDSLLKEIKQLNKELK